MRYLLEVESEEDYEALLYTLLAGAHAMAVSANDNVRVLTYSIVLQSFDQVLNNKAKRQVLEVPITDRAFFRIGLVAVTSVNNHCHALEDPANA